MDTKPLLDCQRALALLWMGFFAAILIVVIAQTSFGNVFMTAKGEDLQKSVWQWMLPATTPTLILVMGVLVNCELVAAARQEAQRRRVSKFFFHLTLGASAFYLTIVLLLPIGAPHKGNAAEAVDMLLQSNVYMTPIQGLISAALGVFFLSPKE
ncbi:hypothetical protein [Sorangium sp. So ce693]|uniref:hypothetical protein n=1 Tax=Sorangium sp. So ce693 TaxID=3133318 RepID=UPI003F62294D